MSNYALIKDGIVENVILWDGETQFPLEYGYELRAADAARIGEAWDDSMITLPPEPIIDPVQPTTTGTQTL
jgi:hypothetical protein